RAGDRRTHLRLRPFHPRQPSRPGVGIGTAVVTRSHRPSQHPRFPLLPLKEKEMLAHPTLDRLNDMGLTGMARAFNELAANAEAERLSHAEWLALLLDREWSWRHDRKLAARLRFAKLRH